MTVMLQEIDHHNAILEVVHFHLSSYFPRFMTHQPHFATTLSLLVPYIVPEGISPALSWSLSIVVPFGFSFGDFLQFLSSFRRSLSTINPNKLSKTIIEDEFQRDTARQL
jgi:hypothetical protein